ncbi:hypothetical protein KIPB_000974 [Kipferlia bialata]|uniref:Uncharacterized protein n=1 Tax=Kipferlia bialata TaxID=797122 RepID=A0A9K3CQ27_9EUKA|nr:hypothetical protein KIPB_000974 [Kipferlia bialata]|eukprot:g974.t1
MDTPSMSELSMGAAVSSEVAQKRLNELFLAFLSSPEMLGRVMTVVEDIKAGREVTGSPVRADSALRSPTPSTPPTPLSPSGSVMSPSSLCSSPSLSPTIPSPTRGLETFVSLSPSPVLDREAKHVPSSTPSLSSSFRERESQGETAEGKIPNLMSLIVKQPVEQHRLEKRLLSVVQAAFPEGLTFHSRLPWPLYLSGFDHSGLEDNIAQSAQYERERSLPPSLSLIPSLPPPSNPSPTPGPHLVDVWSRHIFSGGCSLDTFTGDTLNLTHLYVSDMFLLMSVLRRLPTVKHLMLDMPRVHRKRFFRGNVQFSTLHIYNSAEAVVPTAAVPISSAPGDKSSLSTSLLPPIREESVDAAEPSTPRSLDPDHSFTHHSPARPTALTHLDTDKAQAGTGSGVIDSLLKVLKLRLKEDPVRRAKAASEAAPLPTPTLIPVVVQSDTLSLFEGAATAVPIRPIMHLTHPAGLVGIHTAQVLMGIPFERVDPAQPLDLLVTVPKGGAVRQEFTTSLNVKQILRDAGIHLCPEDLSRATPVAKGRSDPIEVEFTRGKAGESIVPVPDELPGECHDDLTSVLSVYLYNNGHHHHGHQSLHPFSVVSLSQDGHAEGSEVGTETAATAPSIVTVNTQCYYSTRADSDTGSRDRELDTEGSQSEYLSVQGEQRAEGVEHDPALPTLDTLSPVTSTTDTPEAHPIPTLPSYLSLHSHSPTASEGAEVGSTLISEGSESGTEVVWEEQEDEEREQEEGEMDPVREADPSGGLYTHGGRPGFLASEMPQDNQAPTYSVVDDDLGDDRGASVVTQETEGIQLSDADTQPLDSMGQRIWHLYAAMRESLSYTTATDTLKGSDTDLAAECVVQSIIKALPAAALQRRRALLTQGGYREMVSALIPSVQTLDGEALTPEGRAAARRSLMNSGAFPHPAFRRTLGVTGGDRLSSALWECGVTDHTHGRQSRHAVRVQCLSRVETPRLFSHTQVCTPHSDTKGAEGKEGREGEGDGKGGKDKKGEKGRKGDKDKSKGGKHPPSPNRSRDTQSQSSYAPMTSRSSRAPFFPESDASLPLPPHSVAEREREKDGQGVESDAVMSPPKQPSGLLGDPLLRLRDHFGYSSCFDMDPESGYICIGTRSGNMYLGDGSVPPLDWCHGLSVDRSALSKETQHTLKRPIVSPFHPDHIVPVPHTWTGTRAPVTAVTWMRGGCVAGGTADGKVCLVSREQMVYAGLHASPHSRPSRPFVSRYVGSRYTQVPGDTAVSAALSHTLDLSLALLPKSGGHRHRVPVSSLAGLGSGLLGVSLSGHARVPLIDTVSMRVTGEVSVGDGVWGVSHMSPLMPPSSDRAAPMLLAAVHRDMHLYDTRSSLTRPALSVHTPRPVTSIAAHPTGAAVAVGALDGMVAVYDIRAGTKLYQKCHRSVGDIRNETQVGFVGDRGRRLAVGGTRDSYLSIYDTHTSRIYLETEVSYAVAQGETGGVCGIRQIGRQGVSYHIPLLVQNSVTADVITCDISSQ